MSRPFFLLPVLALCAALAACSKKEDATTGSPDRPAPERTTASQRAPAVADAAVDREAPEPEAPSIRFSLPEVGEPSAKKGSESPAFPPPPAPGTPPKPAPGQQPAVAPAAETPKPGEKPTFKPAEMVVFYPPFYPLPLRMEGIEGRIDLGVSISATGEVTDVSVISATAPQFRDYAVAAAKEWRFLPAQLNDKPVPVKVTFPVPFISEFGSGEMANNSPLAGLTYLDGTYYSTGSDGRLSPANIDVAPLLRVTPAFSRPATETKALRVVLNFTVTEQGQVVKPEVVEASGTGFDQAALTAVKYWQFIPQIRNGKPRTASVKLPIVYGAESSTAR